MEVIVVVIVVVFRTGIGRGGVSAAASHDGAESHEGRSGRPALPERAALEEVRRGRGRVDLVLLRPERELGHRARPRRTWFDIKDIGQ